MKFSKILILTMTLAVLAVGCNKKNDSNQDGGEADSQAYISESAVGIVQEAASDSEGAPNGGTSGKPEVSGCPNSLTPTSRCSPNPNVSLINYDSHGNGTGSPCSIGGFNFFGQQQMTFSSPAACSAYNPPASWPASGSTLMRTLSNVSRYNTITGRTLRATTDAKADWQGVSHSGGVLVSYGANPGDRSISVPGVGRTLTGRLGRLIFDHSIYTEQPVQVSGFLRDGTRVVNGDLKVAHNLAHYVSTVSFQNLKWANAQCCYPTSGSVSNTVSGSLNGKFTVTFNESCGLVNFSDLSGHSSTVQLNSCQ